MTDNEGLRDNHHRRALGDPGIWNFTGSNLLVSGEWLVRRATCLDPATKTVDDRVLGSGLMLRGLGIENLLKGLYVLRGGSLRTGKNAGDMPCKHHDLPKMAELAARGDRSLPHCSQLIPTAGEEPMLHSIHACLMFAGRYPIPRDPDDVVMHSNGKRDARVMWSRDFERLLESYLRRISLPFYEGKEISYAGKDKDPHRITWRDVHDQCIDAWVCRPWLDTGGHVGDAPLSPWAASHIRTDRDVRLTW